MPVRERLLAAVLVVAVALIVYGVSQLVATGWALIVGGVLLAGVGWLVLAD
jgi:hypothetical protein